MTQRFSDVPAMFAPTVAQYVFTIKQSMKKWEKTKTDMHLSDCLVSDADAKLCTIISSLELFIEKIKPFLIKYYERTNGPGGINTALTEIFSLKRVTLQWWTLKVTPEMIMKYVKDVESIVDKVFLANIDDGVYIVPFFALPKML